MHFSHLNYKHNLFIFSLPKVNKIIIVNLLINSHFSHRLSSIYALEKGLSFFGITKKSLLEERMISDSFFVNVKVGFVGKSF